MQNLNSLVFSTRTGLGVSARPLALSLLSLSALLLAAPFSHAKGLHLYPGAISVNEDAGEAVIKVARGDDGDNQVSVDYATTDGTAKAGQDYAATAGTLVFNPGEVLKSFSVPILNDTVRENAKSFRVTLSNPTNGVLSSPAVATVTINDTDRLLQLNSTNYLVREEADYVQIGIIQGENDSATTVDITTADILAKAGLDYVGVTNTVRFDAGERWKWVRVPILHDSLKEPGRTFRVTLSNPTGGAVLGTPTTANVTLTDNDPGVGFTKSLYSFQKNAGTVNLGVARGGEDPPGSFTVDFQTVGDTAQAGVDYQAVSGTLEFEAHETLKAIPIPLLPNSAAKGTKSFKVTLSRASEGVPLGRATTRVNIFYPKGYYPIVPSIDVQPKLRQEDGVNLLSWEGDGVLLRADQVIGPWEDLAQVSSPYATRPTLPMGFYRIQHSPRPTEVYVPSRYDGQTRLPLILMLHAMGYTSTFPDIVATVRSGFPLEPLAESRGFLLCYPRGTVDAAGRWFWNGPDFLSFSGSEVDDSGYLRGVIEEIQRRFAVDPKRIYVTGYSSGGAMSHRLALEHADLIAGIASMAGRTYYDPNVCRPTQPVSVLQIHGTADLYLGGTYDFYGLPVVGEAPGAFRTIQIWAGFNGCQNPVVDAAPSLDLTTQVPGIDTTVLRYRQCPPGGAVELWTVNGGDHYLFWNQLAPHFLEYLVDWLLAHPKP
jgi:poly(3-hydroxybutyrate) depolymerase